MLCLQVMIQGEKRYGEVILVGGRQGVVPRHKEVWEALQVWVLSLCQFSVCFFPMRKKVFIHLLNITVIV